MPNQEIVQRVEQRKKEHNRDGYGQHGGHWRDVSFLLDEGRRHMQPGAIQQMIDQINAANAASGLPAYSWKTLPQGAATSVWSGIVAAADEVGGRYCEDCHVAELAEGENIRGGVRAYALDPDRAKALWAKSEEMVGERF